MDIGQIKPSENVLEIIHPGSKQNLGIRISLLSIDDERMKKIRRQILDRQIDLQRKGKAFKSEQIDDNTNLLLFSAMIGWEWYGITIPATATEPERHEPASFHGQNPTFNQTNVYAVFNELTWFRDQIDAKVGDTESFFQT